MPKTLPGFLLLAGTLLLLLGLFSKPLKVKEITIPNLGKSGRIIVAILGVAFLGISAFLYYEWSLGVIPMLEMMEPEAGRRQ
jgi:hypothetical protein